MKTTEAKLYRQPELWVLAIGTAEVIATSGPDPDEVCSDDFNEEFI